MFCVIRADGQVPHKHTRVSALHSLSLNKGTRLPFPVGRERGRAGEWESQQEREDREGQIEEGGEKRETIL